MYCDTLIIVRQAFDRNDGRINCKDLKMERYVKFSFIMSLFVIATQLGAMDPELIHKLLGQKTIREEICNNLSEQDMNRLSQANRQTRGYVGPVIDEHMSERAINYSKAVSAVELRCTNQRHNFADNAGFRDYVLRSLRDFAAHNPDKWIELYLENNQLGNDPAFFEQLMHDIIAVVHELKIDIAMLLLPGNQLISLPENIFAGLTQLRLLDLSLNRLTALPEHIFEGLIHLQLLDLRENQLTALPEHIFAGLVNLQELYFYNNHLAALPEHMFEGLMQLKHLNIGCNPLPANQALLVPDGCKIFR